MKTVMFWTSVFMLSFCNAVANAESSEIFPVSDITIGMSSKALLDKYPTKEILFAKRNDDQTLKGGFIMYPISTNKFWDTLSVVVENGKVGGLSYCRMNRDACLLNGIDAVDYSNVVENIKPLFKQLKQKLGSGFEKKVISRSLEGTDARSAMYVWKREKDVVVFIHTPVALYKKGRVFECQLTIAPTLGKSLSSELATDNVPEDAKLWADAMDE